MRAPRAESGADPSREQALANVSRETLARLDRFVDLVLTWQKTVNLIAPSTIPTIWMRHVADSLQLLDLAPDARIIVDLGSGGGFPGVVLACALAETPGALVHLVESNQKKAAFLREALRITGAPGQVHPLRIEDFTTTFKGRADLVTARAVAPLSDLLALAAPLLETGAKGLFLKGQDIEAELTEASKYWIIEADLLPSKTSPEGRVVLVKRVERQARTRPHE